MKRFWAARVDSPMLIISIMGQAAISTKNQFQPSPDHPRLADALEDGREIRGLNPARRTTSFNFYCFIGCIVSGSRSGSSVNFPPDKSCNFTG
jgi:hypothetical protein